MARRSKKPASRGSVNNIILEVLSEGEKYGYEIIKEVEEKSNGKIVLKQPSLYSSLTRFENKGYVSSYWKESSIGGRRHYYKLTDLGAQTYYNLKHKDDIVEDKFQSNLELDDENINETNNIEDNQILNSENAFFELDPPQDEESFSNTNDIFNNSSYYKLKNYNNFDVSNKLNEILNNDIPSSDSDDDSESIGDSDELTTISDTEKNIIESDSNLTEDIIELEETIESIKNEETQQTLKSIYSNIKNYENENTQTQNNDSLYNFYNEPLDIAPLTYLEQQKRKESLEILYGNAPNKFTHNQESISQSEEQINFEGYLELKKTLNERKYLYKTNKRYTKKQKPFIIKQLYLKPKVDKKTSDLHSIKEKSKPKFTFDEFGIMKIETSDARASKSTNTIIDNVGYRSTDSWHNTNYKGSTTNNQTRNNQVELTQEQIEKKNNDFKEHFNRIAKEKYETQSNKIVDQDESNIQKENLDTYKVIINNSNNEDKFVDLGDEILITQTDNTQNITKEEYNSPNSNLSKYTIKTYGEANSYITDDKSNFIPINKIKFIFTLIFALLNVSLTTLILVLLRSYNLLQPNDIILYQVSYSLTLALVLFAIIPLIINKNKVIENTFNFAYSMMFCLILFIVSLLLNYAFNTLFGFNFTNIKSHISNILVPAVWSVTIILSPVIYRLIISFKTKRK